MSELSPQRRRVVVLAASVACLSAAGPVLLKGHQRLMMVWIGCMVALLIFAIKQFARLKGQER